MDAQEDGRPVKMDASFECAVRFVDIDLTGGRASVEIAPVGGVDYRASDGGYGLMGCVGDLRGDGFACLGAGQRVRVK